MLVERGRMVDLIRNLIQRVIVAAAGIALIAFVTHIGFVPFMLLVMCISVLGVWEFYSLVGNMGFRPQKIFGVLVSILLITMFFFNGSALGFDETRPVILSMLICLLIIAPFFTSMFRKNLEHIVVDNALTVFGVLYVAWTLGHFVLLRQRVPDGEALVFFVFVVVWMLDTGAYAVGMRYGKHKIVPKISPHKSWGGSIAGFVCAVGTALVYREMFLLSIPRRDAVLLGCIIGIIAQLSDFAESVIKRNAGKKDSGTLLPGHGGILDRFDSFIFVVPVVYYYVVVMC